MPEYVLGVLHLGFSFLLLLLFYSYNNGGFPRICFSPLELPNDQEGAYISRIVKWEMNGTGIN